MQAQNSNTLPDEFPDLTARDDRYSDSDFDLYKLRQREIAVCQSPVYEGAEKDFEQARYLDASDL